MITHFRVSGALRLNAEDHLLCIAMSVDQDHQRLGIAEGVISRTTEAQLQRVTSGRQAAHEAVQSIPSESGPPSQPNGSEVTCATGGAEEFDARPARENAWLELEDLVISGKKLCWSGALSAETSNEECREQNAADFRVEPSVTREMDQELQHVLVSRTDGEALEVILGAEREPGLEQWRRPAALLDPLAARRRFGQLQANFVSAKSHQNRKRNVNNKRRERRGDQLPKDMRLAVNSSPCALQTCRKN